MTYRAARVMGGALLAAAVLTAAGCASPDDEWVAGWQATNAMTTPRAGAAFVQVSGTIYVLGGIDGKSFLRSTELSHIDTDGTPGQWQLSSPLREARGFFGAAYFNGYLYAAGGGNGPSGHHLLRTVERAAVLPTGNLGDWQTEKSRLVFPSRCAKLVVAGDDMYAIGGFSGVLMDTVQHAKILPDGHLGPWSVMNEKLTSPRYIDAVNKNRKGIYVIGGHAESGGTGLNTVEWRPLSPAQKNNMQWRATAALNTGRYALEAASHDDYVYAMGGLNGAQYLDSDERARMNADGALGSWAYTTKLSSPRANFGTVIYKDWIYVIGGTSHGKYYRSVERATFNDKGDIGFWGTPRQAEAFHDRQLQQREKQARAVLPNAGVVEKLVQTDAYSYVEVRTDSGSQWLAGPRLDLKVHDRIRYSQGVEMGDFYSRQLQRHFDSIRFVEDIEKVK